jgi:hypothetical protein
MRTRALFACAAVVATGCSNPASLKITVTALEPTLSAIELEVRLASAMMSADLLDCRFEKGRRTGAKCSALEASRVEWGGCHDAAPCDPLTFIVFGNANAKITVAATGFNAAGAAITSVTRTLKLPSTGTETATVVTLEAAHLPECTASLTTRNGNVDDAFVAPIPSSSAGKLDVFAVSAGGSSIWSYDPKPSGTEPCTLTKIAEGPACSLARQFGAVVIGNVLGGPELESVAMCTSGGVSFLAIAPLVPSAEMGHNLATTPVKIPFAGRTRVSLPVLADMDGDGKDEIAVLYQPEATGNTDVALQVFFPDNVTTTSTGVTCLPPSCMTTVAIAGITNADSTGGIIPFSPMVFPADSRRDGLVVAGTYGGFATYDRTGGLQVTRRMAGTGAAARSDWGLALFKRAQAITLTEQLRFLVGPMVMNPRVELNLVDLGTRAVFRSEFPLTDPITPGKYQASRFSRIAIGDVAGDGTKTAVIGTGAQLILFPMVSGMTTTARALSLPVDSLVGGMTVLLANVDHRPGLEVIAYNGMSGLIFAVDKDGASVPGFPVTVTSGNATVRAVIDDLDGDGSTELVTVAFNALKVFTLGPDSYDKSATPWPMHFRDLRSSAANLTESDPLR